MLLDAQEQIGPILDPRCRMVAVTWRGTPAPGELPQGFGVAATV